MVGGRVHQKRVTIEVSGAKSVLRNPVRQMVNFNLTFRDFLRDIVVDRKKLVGCKVTTVKGTWKNAVSLDSLIKDFIRSKFVKKKTDCFRVRLVKKTKRCGLRSGQGASEGEQVVYTIEDDDDGDARPVVPPVEEAGTQGSGTSDDGGEGIVEQEEGSGRGILEQTPEEAGTQASGSSDQSGDSGEVVDEQQPSPSRDAEQIARDRTSMPAPPPPPPSSIRPERNVVRVKSEIPDAESAVSYLRANNVSIDDLKTQVRQRMATFKNAFLNLSKQELLELQSLGGQHWQSFVRKAPMCAHLLAELFNSN